jgi:hypothetical protein
MAMKKMILTKLSSKKQIEKVKEEDMVVYLKKGRFQEK